MASPTPLTAPLDFGRSGWIFTASIAIPRLWLSCRFYLRKIRRVVIGQTICHYRDIEELGGMGVFHKPAPLYDGNDLQIDRAATEEHNFWRVLGVPTLFFRRCPEPHFRPGFYISIRPR